MKPQLTLLAFFLFFSSLTAQVRFKVKLLTDNQTFQVSMRPDVTYSGSNATIQFAQVSLRAPVGFTLGNVVNQKGTWTLTTVPAPAEAPGYNYFLIALDNPVIALPSTVFTKGVEIPLFTVKRTGASGLLSLLDNDTDPFNVEPNSASISGVGNFIQIAGAGQGVDAFSGSYSNFPADTRDDASDCSEIFDVALVPPSTCGLADGSITISATNDFNPMQYTITLGAGQNEVWQASPVFSGLAAGDTYYVAIRGAAVLCDVNNAGEFELPGPLAAIIQNVDQNNPSCGGTNGSIVIQAISASGGPLEYAMSSNGPWQSSSTFNNLAEGTYSFWVRDFQNGCQDPVGTYTLTGCVPQTCNATIDLQYLGNGRYEVNFVADTTMSAPWNMVNNLQLTFRVPTGCFEVSNVTSQLPNVDFANNGTTVAPPENPGFDYISFGITNTPTTNVPFVEGNTVHLFTFENSGGCVGDSIRFIPDNDPALNNQSASLGHLMTVLGFSNGTEICIGDAAALIGTTPPAPPACDISLAIQNLGSGLYGVSMTPDTTFTAPWNSIGGMQLTVRTETGGFVASNIESQIPNVVFEYSGSVISPSENPNYDYFSFNLGSAGTTLIPYVEGQPVLLFTFENTGNCVGDSIGYMLPNDPVLNSTTFSLSQQVTVAGLLGEAIICFSNTTVVCDSINNDPCFGTMPNFGPLQGCEGAQIDFKDSTITNGTIASWSWNFGDGSPAVSGQNPSHTYSSSGNFEVSLTVTTQEGCDTTFMEFVTVFPSPGDAPVNSYTICSGVPVTIETPDNITSAVWSPTNGLDLTDPFNPIANPATNTTYTLTATNSYGCVNTSQVAVVVKAKPVLSNVTITEITDCNKTDGTITITASGTAGVEYGLDSGSGIVWQTTNSFSALAPGSYSVYIRNADDSCPVAYNNNPIVLLPKVAPSIISISQAQPVGCNNNGSITINATGGTAPLQYSITGAPPFSANNVFSNLGAGTYNIVVRNNDGTCAQTAGPFVFTQPTPPTIGTPVADQTICLGSTINISIPLSTPIASYTINGSASYAGATINGSTLTFPVTATLGATNYTVVLKNASDCTATETFSITGVPTPASSFSVSSVICANGNVVLNFTGTSLPTANLDWNLAGAQVISASQQSGSIPANATMVVKWATSGTKTVTLVVSNGGNCQASSNQTINVSTFNPGATFAITDASCGLSNGAINMSVIGSGFNYNWSNGPTTEDIGSLAVGSYFVTITDAPSGCQTTASATVNGSPALNITNISTNPATLCTGGNGDGSLTIQLNGGSPGYTYTITGQTPVSISMPTVTFNNLMAGIYSVTVTDSRGCTDVETVTLTSISSTVNVAVTTANAACTGNNGSLTAIPSGGTTPYTYTLIKNNIVISSNQTVTGTQVMLNGLEPAIYTLIFQDANGCIAAGTGNVVRNAGVFSAIETITPASCGSNNGAISLAGIPAGATVAPSQLTNLAAGPYTVTITEANGCTSSKTFVVTTSGGQTVAITLLNNASCGLANGSVLYNVTGGGAFSYTVLGANVASGFGTPGVQDTITGLKEGAYVLEVTDLTSSSNCKSFQVFSVGGSSALQTTVVVDRASGCGYHDGEIHITVEGAQAPYSIFSNAGTVQSCGAANEFCVTGLYEGIVQVDINAAGCAKSISTDMGEFVEPSLALDSVIITNSICPDDMGEIHSATNKQYQIHDATTGILLETTPWTQAPQGAYLIIETIDGCSDSLMVEVDGPADWTVVASIVPDSCLTAGSVTLAVSGANGPYDYHWDNDEDTQSINGLSFGTYNVTITDAAGCLYTGSYEVNDECQSPPCEDIDIFYVDTIFQTLEASLTAVCLPTELTNLELYNLVLDSEPYDRTIGDCGDSITFYDGFDMLPLPGPYVLASWEYDGPGSPLTNFPFANVNELLAKMKELDNLGNWVYSNGRISGGKDGFDYKDMFIKEVNSGIITESPASQQIVPKPMILVDNLRFDHILVATHPVFGCLDTLFINLVNPNQDEPDQDTIAIEIGVGETIEECIPVNELFGNLESIENTWISLTNNAQVISNGDSSCITIIGVDEGPDQAIIVICDDLGVCDTTYILINVIDASTEIEVYTGFSPNDDGVNDFFTIRNIHRYPKNSLTVFNRWGKSVLDVKGYNNYWNGLYRNTKLPDGTYFYILNVEVDGEDKEFKGFVEMRR